MKRFGTGMAMVAAAGMLTTGAFAADEQVKPVDELKVLHTQIREAKAALSQYERGRMESPAVRAAKEAAEKERVLIDSKPEVVEALKARTDAEIVRKGFDEKIKETYKSIESTAELVELKKKSDEATAAWKAKYEELVKANAALADLAKSKDAANKAIGEADAKLIQIRLAGNTEVADLKKKIADLEAKIALLTPKKAEAKAPEVKPEEKKIDEAKPEAKKVEAAKPAAQ